MSINIPLENHLLYENVVKQMNINKENIEIETLILSFLDNINLLAKKEIENLNNSKFEIEQILMNDTKLINYNFSTKEYEQCLSSYELSNELLELLNTIDTDKMQNTVIQTYLSNLEELSKIYFDFTIYLSTINSKQTIIKA